MGAFRVFTDRFGNMRLAKRLTVGFVFMAAVIAATGMSGIYFVNAIQGSVATFADVSSPLVDQTTTLVDGMRKAHVAVLGSLEDDSHETGDHAAEGHAEAQPVADGAEQQGGAETADGEAAGQHVEVTTEEILNSLDETNRAGFQRLRDLAGQAAQDIDTAPVTEWHAAFIDQSRQMLTLHTQMLEKAGIAADRLAQFEADRQALDKLVSGVSQRYESNLGDTEDSARTYALTADARVENLVAMMDTTFNVDFVLLRSAYTLRSYLVQLQDTARVFVTNSDTGRLAKAEKSVKKLVKKLRSRLKRMTARVKSSQEKQQIAEVTKGIGKLEKGLLGEDGAFAAHRAALAANAEASALRNGLTATIAAYEAELNKVSDLARSLNDTAKTAAGTAVDNARVMILGIVVIGVLIAAAFGFLFTKTIVGPIRTMTTAMVKLASGDTSTQIPALERREEIGEMAQAVQVFKENAIEKLKFEGQQKEEAAREERRSAMIQIADSFEASVLGVVVE